jgi:ligand-binding sensor domain-containing protein
VGTGSPEAGSGGLNRIDPKTGLITRYRNDPEDTTSLGQNWVLGILKDPRDKLWINHTGGVDFFDPQTETFEHVVKDTSRSGFRGVLIDSRDNILIEDGVRNSWLLLDSKTKAIVKKGKLFGRGLGVILAYPYLDQKSRIWIASVNGFGFTSEEYDGLKFWLSYEDFGYPDLEIKAFSDDDQGNVYFASSEGIFQYNPETGKTVRFGSERGLQSNLFNTKLNNRGPSGKFTFPEMGG